MVFVVDNVIEFELYGPIIKKTQYLRQIVCAFLSMLQINFCRVIITAIVKKINSGKKFIQNMCNLGRTIKWWPNMLPHSIETDEKR